MTTAGSRRCSYLSQAIYPTYIHPVHTSTIGSTAPRPGTGKVDLFGQIALCYCQSASDICTSPSKTRWQQLNILYFHTLPVHHATAKFIVSPLPPTTKLTDLLQVLCSLNMTYGQEQNIILMRNLVKRQRLLALA